MVPSIPLDTKLPKSAEAMLILPDGSTLKAKANFEIPFIRFLTDEARKNYQPGYLRILRGIKKQSVPVETEV